MKNVSAGPGAWRRYGDGLLFLAVAAAVALWAAWYLAQPAAEPRLRFALDELAPPSELTLAELDQHNARMSRRCAELLAEVKVLRGARPGSAEAAQLDLAVQKVDRGAFVEDYLRRYTVADHEAPLGSYHEKLVTLGDKVDQAKRYRNVESFLQALAATAGGPAEIEGFYTDLWSHEMIVRKRDDQYEVIMGGGYWPTYNGSWVHFFDQPKGRVIDTRYRAQDWPDEAYVHCTVKFDRGLAVVTADGPGRTVCVSGIYVKVADFKPIEQEFRNEATLGTGGASADAWHARQELVKRGLAWTSQARTGFCPSPHVTIETCEKYLGTYKEPAK